jgi:hypothetical protein
MQETALPILYPDPAARPADEMYCTVLYGTFESVRTVRP